MGSKKFGIAAARTWRSIRTPQGIAAGAVFACFGPVVNWWFHRDAQAMRQIISALWLISIPFLGYVFLLFAYHYIDLLRGPKRAVLIGGNITTRTNDRAVGIGPGSNGFGVFLLAGLLDATDLLPFNPRWEVTDVSGDMHACRVSLTEPAAPNFACPFSSAALANGLQR